MYTYVFCYPYQLKQNHLIYNRHQQGSSATESHKADSIPRLMQAPDRHGMVEKGGFSHERSFNDYDISVLRFTYAFYPHIFLCIIYIHSIYVSQCSIYIYIYSRWDNLMGSSWGWPSSPSTDGQKVTSRSGLYSLIEHTLW